MTLSWQWVIEDELEEVFSKLDLIYKINPQVIEGTGMAFVVKRLLACEVTVGGPYKNLDGQVDSVANAMVDTFLRRTGTELPNLEPYRHKTGLVISSRNTKISKEYEQIKSTIQAELKLLPTSIRPVAEQVWKAICRVDKNHEIGLISYFFIQSSAIKRPSSQQLKKLGLANFYIWMAYTIYDDFFDDEGTPAMLPFANIAMRTAFLSYKEAWPDKGSEQLVKTTFLGMDEANSWEMTNARATVDDLAITLPATLPQYNKNYLLADRALGHVLGPLLIVKHQPDISVEEYDAIYEGLRQFLILRQLNDDIHDWHKDLHAGHLSPVVTYLLQKGGYNSGKYNLSLLTKKLEKYFWDKGLVELCKITLSHAKKCRRAFHKTRLMNEKNDFARLIDRLEDAMIASQEIHSNQKDFLETYKNLSD